MSLSACSDAAANNPRDFRVPDDGFTIVETLIALLLILLVGLGSAQLVLGSVEAVRDSDFTTVASMLAMEKFEELRQHDFDDTDLIAGEYSESDIVGFPEFTRSWLIEDDAPSVGLKRITVTVTALWGNRGQPRSASAVTYRASPAFAAGITP
jgi:Tfp pilus assembly protein PilV